MTSLKNRQHILKYLFLAIVLTLGICLLSAKDSRAAVTINDTALPLEESGYRTGDYRGAGMCWEFARHVYYNIWGCFFYQNPGTEDDMLRDYPFGEERRINAENARLFITAAPLGSVIRLQAVAEGPDSTQCNRHSLILIGKTQNGCTVYHDWAGYAEVETLTWNEFVSKFRTEVDFGYFKYIKYPGAKALQFKYSEGQMKKELVISSRMYGTAELAELKR